MPSAHVVFGVVTFLRCAPVLVACACQPMVFPRTADVAKPGKGSFQGSAQLVTIEPQEVVESDGKKSSSTVGFVPDFELQAHFGLGRCEIGGVGVDLGALAELRCALTRQSHGDALSTAFSGAAGATASAGIGFAPSARLGLDASRRFGPVEIILDVYVTSQRQAHYIQTGVVNDPVVGPSGVILGRQELRLAIPVGLAVDLGDPDHRGIFGVEPWFVLAGTSHTEIDPVARSYAIGGWGMAFTLGFSYR